MSDTGVKYPATVSTVKETGDDNDWVDPSNVGANDAAYASITATTFDTGDVSYLLKATNFSMGVPTGATINGILVEIERYCDSGEVCEDVDVCLTKDGSARVGDDKSAGADFNAGSVTTVSFGGAADLWGTTWTAAEVNASTFGVLYKMGAVNDNADGYVDFIRVTITYTVVAQTYYKTLTGVAVGSAVLSRNLSLYRTLAATATGVGVLSKASTFYRTLGATAVGVGAMVTARLYSKTLAAVAQGVAVITRVATYAQTLQATAVGQAILTRAASFFRTMTVAAVGQAVLTRVSTHYRTMAATAAGTPTMGNVLAASRTLGATANGQPTLSKSSVFAVSLDAIAQGVVGLTTSVIHSAIKSSSNLFHVIRVSLR